MEIERGAEAVPFEVVVEQFLDVVERFGGEVAGDGPLVMDVVGSKLFEPADVVKVRVGDEESVGDGNRVA